MSRVAGHVPAHCPVAREISGSELGEARRAPWQMGEWVAHRADRAQGRWQEMTPVGAPVDAPGSDSNVDDDISPEQGPRQGSEAALHTSMSHLAVLSALDRDLGLGNVDHLFSLAEAHEGESSAVPSAVLPWQDRPFGELTAHQLAQEWTVAREYAEACHRAAERVIAAVDLVAAEESDGAGPQVRALQEQHAALRRSAGHGKGAEVCRTAAADAFQQASSLRARASQMDRSARGRLRSPGRAGQSASAQLWCEVGTLVERGTQWTAKAEVLESLRREAAPFTESPQRDFAQLERNWQGALEQARLLDSSTRGARRARLSEISVALQERAHDAVVRAEALDRETQTRMQLPRPRAGIEDSQRSRAGAQRQRTRSEALPVQVQQRWIDGGGQSRRLPGM